MTQHELAGPTGADGYAFLVDDVQPGVGKFLSPARVVDADHTSELRLPPSVSDDNVLGADIVVKPFAGFRIEWFPSR
jgi:hypothetical protein